MRYNAVHIQANIRPMTTVFSSVTVMLAPPVVVVMVAALGIRVPNSMTAMRTPPPICLLRLLPLLLVLALLLLVLQWVKSG